MILITVAVGVERRLRIHLIDACICPAIVIWVEASSIHLTLRNEGRLLAILANWWIEMPLNVLLIVSTRRTHSPLIKLVTHRALRIIIWILPLYLIRMIVARRWWWLIIQIAHTYWWLAGRRRWHGSHLSLGTINIWLHSLVNWLRLELIELDRLSLLLRLPIRWLERPRIEIICLSVESVSCGNEGLGRIRVEVLGGCGPGSGVDIHCASRKMMNKN